MNQLGRVAVQKDNAGSESLVQLCGRGQVLEPSERVRAAASVPPMSPVGEPSAGEPLLETSWPQQGNHQYTVLSPADFTAGHDVTAPYLPLS